jgi:Arc/MetJ-type ribon-helix-helix transcriptional regulator
MKEEKKTVSLPAELYGKIEQRIAGTEFSSVDEYANFVLTEVLKEEESETSFNKEDEEEIRRRLRDLGYSD